MTESGGVAPPLEIRSYRCVFELERRVYRIDRLRLPPGGIPMRGAVYCLVLVLSSVVASALPLIGLVAAALPWYLRDIAVPIVLAMLLTVVRLEGRPFHLAARALVRHRVGPRWWRGLRPASAPGAPWYPDALLMVPDGSDARWRAFAFSGPGAVMVEGAYECRDRRGGPLAAVVRRPHVTLHERPRADARRGRRVIVLSDGARLRLRPDAGRGRGRRSSRRGVR